MIELPGLGEGFLLAFNGPGQAARSFKCMLGLVPTSLYTFNVEDGLGKSQHILGWP